MVSPCLPIRPVLLLSAGMSALQRQFRTSAYWSIRQLVCEIDSEQIVLRGTLPSYYLKQVAQSLAARVVGVERMHSDIEVEKEEMAPSELKNRKRAETVLAN